MNSTLSLETSEQRRASDVASGAMVRGRATPAEAFFLAGWRNKLDLIRSRQHVDSVCGVRWGDSYRTYMVRKRERCWRSIRRLTEAANVRQPTSNVKDQPR
jgi:hypothetical protein